MRVYQFRHIRAEGQCSRVKPEPVATRTMSRLPRAALLAPIVLGSLALFAVAGATARTGPAAPRGDLVEVVVTLPQPPLSEAILHDRGLAAAATVNHRVDVRAPASVSYLRTLAAAQRQLQARIARAIPQARVRWHYGVVLNGVAVVVPRSQLGRLGAMKGLTVWPTVTYHALLDRTPQLIGAPTLWGPTLATAGNGMKIGIIDDGLDQTHVVLQPDRLQLSARLPAGQHRVHDAEGDRRARIRACRADVEVREHAVRPGVLGPRDARRRHRRRRPRHDRQRRGGTT